MKSSLRESVIALNSEKSELSKKVSAPRQLESSIQKHRARQERNMGKPRPSGLLEGILYDMEHFDRFGLSLERRECGSQ